MNKATISGIMQKEFMYSHDSYDERFYRNAVEVMEEDGKVDVINIVAREKLILPNCSYAGEHVTVFGDCRTSKKLADCGSQIILFAKEIGLTTPDVYRNEVYVRGFLQWHYIKKTSEGDIKVEGLISVKKTNSDRKQYFDLPFDATGDTARKLLNIPAGRCVRASGTIINKIYEKWNPYSNKNEERKITILLISRIEQL